MWRDPGSATDRLGNALFAQHTLLDQGLDSIAALFLGVLPLLLADQVALQEQAPNFIGVQHA